MANIYTNSKQPGVLRSLDWWTIVIYIALIAFGWLSVCGATFSFDNTDIFSFATNSQAAHVDRNVIPFGIGAPFARRPFL